MDNKLISNCIIIGIFTVIVGYMTEKTLNKFNRKNNFLSNLKQSTFKFIITLFLFGVSLHLLLEYSGFEANCIRKCDTQNNCNYVCTIKVKDIIN